jgi:hypothetical protein
MNQQGIGDKIDSLLGELERAEAVSFDLGTPELPEGDALKELVAMGAAIVPHLLSRVGEDTPKKRVAHIASVLRALGDRRALEPLLAVRMRFERLEGKDAWDYAVIGQCNLAIEALRRSGARG